MSILEAPYSGVIKLGEFELPCYVLNDGTACFHNVRL